MGKKRKPRRSGSSKKYENDGIPLIVLISSGALTLIGYLAGEILFISGPHPMHWLLALIGGPLGWMLGNVYYRFRGDIV